MRHFPFQTRAKILGLRTLAAFTFLMMVNCLTQASPAVVPDDIAYKPVAQPQLAQVDMAANTCGASTNRTDLHKSVAITRFLRETPRLSNGGNLYAVEEEVPELLRGQLTEKHRSISPAVLPLGFAAPDLNEDQLQRQAQKIARQSQSQFVLSGSIIDMGMPTPEANYNPNLPRRAVNVIHDTTALTLFDKRTRGFSLSVQLRDGHTGELLFTKDYATSGVWNERRAVSFDSAAFYKTHYGKNVMALTQRIGDDLARVLECQPFMASIDSQPGQAQILIQGGGNNGLHAGDKLSVYQVMVIGSSTDYQVTETRLVKREARLHLREVYPSHSVAQVEGGSYLNGQYLAVSD